MCPGVHGGPATPCCKCGDPSCLCNGAVGEYFVAASTLCAFTPSSKHFPSVLFEVLCPCAQRRPLRHPHLSPPGTAVSPVILRARRVPQVLSRTPTVAGRVARLGPLHHPPRRLRLHLRRPPRLHRRHLAPPLSATRTRDRRSSARGVYHARNVESLLAPALRSEPVFYLHIVKLCTGTEWRA